MKLFITMLLALSGYLHADTITGWEIVGNNSTDKAIYQMKSTVEHYPYALLVNSNVSEEQITGKIIAVYKGELNLSRDIQCEAPKNLFEVQEQNNEYLSEMFVLCKSVTVDNNGIYVLRDTIVIPRTRTPFLPEIALRRALQLP